MKILEFGRLSSSKEVLPIDEVRLYHNDKIVHVVAFKKATFISHFACISINNNIGYIVGNKNLEQELLNKGFTKQ